MRPHRRQPTRLPCPWDSPGKDSGVGCHFLLQCMKVKSESEVAQSCPTCSDPMDCSPPDSSVHGIFQARILEWGAIAFFEKRAGAYGIRQSVGNLVFLLLFLLTTTLGTIYLNLSFQMFKIGMVKRTPLSLGCCVNKWKIPKWNGWHCTRHMVNSH